MPGPLRVLRARGAPVVKRALSDAAAYSGLYRLAGLVYGGRGVILMLHRVVEAGRPVLWPGYAIDADQLDALLAATRRLGWEPIAIDEVPGRLAGGGSERRFACFTLDDGYADNLHVALPVFRKHRAPFCVYVATGLVERAAFYWWGALEELVTRTERVAWVEPGGGARALPARTWREKQLAYDALNDACDRGGPEVARALLEAYAVDWRAVMDRDLLTKEDVRALAAEPLATIGAHGVTHQRLGAMAEPDAARELVEARRILEGWTGEEVRHLAYPFGAANACGPREFELARRAGYATAVTTRRGNLFPAHREHLTSLPRREAPIDRVKLRNVLFGVDTVLRGSARLQTS